MSNDAANPLVKPWSRLRASLLVSVAAALGICGTYCGTAAYAQVPRVVWQSRIHHAGEIWLNVQNSGNLGSAHGNAPRATEDLEALRINWEPSLEFPGGSKLNYLYVASPMFGCVNGIDTLVSTGFFFWYGYNSELNSFATISETSARQTTSRFDPSALADEEFYSVFSDTATAIGALQGKLDHIEQRTHKPIGIEVHQTSRAWSDGTARRFIILDLWFKNVSNLPIRRSCIAINLYPDSRHHGRSDNPDQIQNWNRVSGFMQDIPPNDDAPSDATIDLPMAWFSGANGAPSDGRFDEYSRQSVAACVILRSPPGQRSFNWWTPTQYETEGFFEATWGPRKSHAGWSYSARLASPLGDRALYQLMTNGEIDYDQMYAAMDFTALGWSPPASDPEKAQRIAAGEHGTTLHLSVGPIADIAPGDSVPFTYALVVGEKFHTRPDNFARNFDPQDPSRYRDNLDFSDLIINARAADWHFDNPGVDTDGDGYAGKFYLENCIGSDSARCDTVWYKGDGVPDWGGPQPPVPPKIEISTRPHGATLRWTGEVSEIGKDRISRQRDFEGYRVYTARTNTAAKYALVASWDLPDNYRRIGYNEQTGDWRQIAYPLPVDRWREVLADETFDPEKHRYPSLHTAYRDIVIDTVRDASGGIVRIEERLRYSFFEPEGPNFGNTYLDGGPRRNPIQRVEIRDTLVDDQWLSYGVYEMELDNLSAAVPLWFAVTAFDHGDYKRNLDPLESSPAGNAEFAFPQYSADVVMDSAFRVQVYPNPYKTYFKDGMGNPSSYYSQGFEGYGNPVMDERDRRIWFANLPDTATIRIYSLDGDLIREIHHPDPFLTSYSSIVGWDLVSRNTQAVVSGIYLYRVDSRLGSQIGKLVIIK